MRSISKSKKKNNNKKKIVLGKKTTEGYNYKTKVDFSEDLSLQISRLIDEKKANEAILKKIKELKEVAKKFSEKEKNISYYYTLGQKLMFLDEKFFKKIARYSVFRRIIEELPEILPHIKNKQRALKHLDFMYNIAHIDRKYLSKASWDQWFEIMKFKEIYRKKKALHQILNLCQNKASGPILRNEIKKIIKN